MTNASVLDEGRRLVAAGKHDAVLRLLADVPDSAERDTLLGAAWVGRRKRERAFAHLERARSERPQDPEILFHLAGAYLLDHDPARAVRALEAVAVLAPDFPGLTVALTGALRRDARYADAIALAEQGLGTARRVEDRVQLLFEKAVGLTALSDAPGALDAFDALLALQPDHAAAWFTSHAPALSALGEEEAMRRLLHATGCPGANGKYWSFVSAYALLRGRRDEAARIRKERIGDHPRRRALPDSVEAVRPDLTADWRLFGLSADLLRHALAAATVSGLVLEFGVRRGTSIHHLAAAAGQTVHGFDSFVGLPEAWDRQAAGTFALSPERRELPLVPGNVVLHPGWFEETLDPFLAAYDGPVRLVNIDSDIYSSARTVLAALAPRLRPGSILVFDEYIGNRTWREDEYKAFQEFVREHAVRYECFAVAPFTKQVAMRLTAIG